MTFPSVNFRIYEVWTAWVNLKKNPRTCGLTVQTCIVQWLAVIGMVKDESFLFLASFIQHYVCKIQPCGYMA